MATTRGQGTPETPKAEQAKELIAGAIAGQGVLRRVLLYVLAFALCVSPAPVLGVLPLALLLATDTGLS